ncbi:MAG: glycosyltransferase family 2 protein [Candidatus Methanoperedens sp.]|nr:glycosyltransferase family 2 protein [Candidatus Methanoperedens sp.]
MKIIAVIPAYNEEIAIGSVVLKTRPHVDEVFVVDASTDYTAWIAKAAGAVVIKQEKKEGYGAALRYCFKAGKDSNADVMVILDADGQHNPEDIDRMIQPVLNGTADIVIGSRFTGEIKSDIPAYRRIGMKIIDAIANRSIKTSDSQSGFRAYSRKAIESINISENGMGAGAEILIDGASKQLSITEVPIKVRYDVGKSSQHPVVQGISTVKSLIWFFAERHVLLSFGAVGIVMLLIGVSMGFIVIELYRVKLQLAVGLALISVMSSLIGMYMLFTGIILYVVKDLIERRLKL